MTVGSVGGLAIVADKGQEFDADGGKAKLFRRSAVGTSHVVWQPCQLFNSSFGSGHDDGTILMVAVMLV
jgi:hypothetical protein